MATILERRNRDGQLIGYQAQVRKRGYPTQVKTFGKRTDAVAWATVTESEMIRGVHVDRSKAERTTFADAIDDYIRDEAPNHRGARDEILRLKRFIRDEPKLVAHSLATLTTRMFEKYRDRRLAVVSASTVKRELGLLHTVVEYVRKTHAMAENPVSEVGRPQVNDDRVMVLDEGKDEGGRLIEACIAARNPWLLPAVLLAMETALRRGALLALRWENVDLPNKAISTEVTIRGKNVPKLIPLSSLAVAVLDGMEISPDGRVIGTTADGLKQAFERARSRAGLEHFNFHDLRHVAATKLFDRGWNPLEVAAVTGHQDLKMLKRYIHPNISALAAKMG